MESIEDKVKYLKPLGRKPNINLIRFPEGKYRTSYMKDIPSYRFKKPNETQGAQIKISPQQIHHGETIKYKR